MIKKLALALAAAAVVALILRYESVSASLFLEVSSWVKARYHAALEAVDEGMTLWFNQAETIEALLEENRRLRQKEQTLNAFAAEVLSLSRLKGYEVPPQFSVRTVRALSYAALPDMHKILLDYEGLEPNEVRGLIYNNQTAGIAVHATGSQTRALLNGDAKCSYAVYIGDNRVPGIIMGKSDQEMIVRYIPAWMQVEEGDKVVTSGLDGIFFAGVKVGTVTKVHRLNAYIEATVKPHYNAYSPGYFYLVDSIR